MGIRLKPYPEYKDSGLPWLGKIPDHWDTCRLKYLLREVNVRSSDGAERLLSVSQYTGITPRHSRQGQDKPETRAETLAGYKQVLPNDLVVNIMLAWNGSLGISQFDGIVSPAYCVYRFSKILEPGYYHHLLRSPIYKGRIKTASTGVVESRLRLYSDALFRIEALIPSKREQTTIASFVEVLNRKVDRLIRTKRRLIELLNEQKASIINRAVMWGLDPDIPMKASGNVWLGEIPAQWETKKLGQICSKIADGPHFSPDYVDQGIMFLSARNIKTDRWALGDVKYISIEDYQEFCKRIKPEIGDVLYTKGGTTGVARVVDLESPFNVWVHVAVLKIKREQANPYYVAYALNSAFCYQQSQLYTRGATNKDLGLTRMVNIVLPLPGLIEQDMIVSSVDKQISAINETISKAEREVGLIKEYRTTLIADVVTGKLDVRDVKLHELEEVGNLTSRDDEMIDDALEEAGELEMIKAGTDADD